MKVNKIPFSLKDYKTGKYEVVSKGGKGKPIIFRTNSCNEVYPIQGAYDYKNDIGDMSSIVMRWDENGHSDNSGNNPNDLLLEEAIYEKGDFVVVHCDTEEDFSIIYKEDKNDDIYYFASFDKDGVSYNGGIPSYGIENYSLRIATEDEKICILCKLFEDGKIWDEESMTISCMSNKYNIGDKVIVENVGMKYPYYEDMFKALGFDNDNVNDAKCDKMSGVIFAIGFLPKGKEYVYGIDLTSGEQVLMGEEGIELITENKADFKEGQSVLVRNDLMLYDDDYDWNAALFIDYRKGESYPYITTKGRYNHCIDYKTNKKLLD